MLVGRTGCMIELRQVTKQYGQATILKNITLSIDEPGIYCLLGRNGAGKTTLLKSIAGYQNYGSLSNVGVSIHWQEKVIVVSNRTAPALVFLRVIFMMRVSLSRSLSSPYAVTIGTPEMTFFALSANSWCHGVPFVTASECLCVPERTIKSSSCCFTCQDSLM